ncbi:hypothetical protein [Pedobacter sp.]|jgi:hypothetical protein|uniref:hypothetical protein n=1 Tax=Pedobacter sp. TaxID=1411316 RepID=UPI002B7934EB|nr:hypothetical protein [Pedobacter sp.]HWW41933.1 hypothetical protein [Pedobacter sp.]
MRSIKQVASSSLLIAALALTLFGCHSKPPRIYKSEYDKILTEREKQAASKRTDSLGALLSVIRYEIATDNKKDFEDGIIPWASLEKPELDIPHLVDKDKVVIPDNHVTVIIDYPLNNEYRFELTSPSGFTRELLLREISKHYYQLYKEEEETAKTKTVPLKERKELYNRNQTDGKYGIWGHDIADLVLTEVKVYKNSEGKILLQLGVDS